MSQDQWTSVDTYIGQRLFPEDPILSDVLVANAAAGLPAIDVSAAQGRFLALLVRMTGARRILEIGTLGGYSTVCLARAVPAGGVVVTLEADPHHAAVARGNIERAGLSDRVDVRLGAALGKLAEMTGTEPFDLVFIDADKPNNPRYLAFALALSRPGTVIVADNVVRDGSVTDGESLDASVIGTRALFDAIAAEPRLTATALQTVGAKGWDGFILAIVS